uniref:Sodium/nucleoside cotransporter n=1 Tax=Phallusia mammillata TaxID=59560 RepID=A0A6F9DT59_9ASCI|nr:sodium/nucleoside cotransporter 1-like [Phallusia mammillata]
MSENHGFHEAGKIIQHKKHIDCSINFCAHEIPHTLDDICGKETALNESEVPLLDDHSPRANANNSAIVDIESNSSGFSSYLTNTSDENGVDSSQKKLMSTPDNSANDLLKHEKLDIEDDDDDHNYETTSFLRFITTPIHLVTQFFADNKSILLKIFGVAFFLGITAYMIVACIWNLSRAMPLLVIWCVVVGYNIYALFRDHYGAAVTEAFYPLYKLIGRNMTWIKWLFIAIVVAGLAVWIALDTSKRPEQLVSGGGYLVFLFGLFITSKYPDRVIWRPVLWGYFIQVCFGMFILRTQAGFEAFNWVGNLAQTFINYVDAGAEFVFGESFQDHYFAFKVLPIVLYFGAFISIMYYLGAMQWLIFKIAWLMQISLNTSATESMVAAGNIFVGQTESPLLIRPYINDLTTSELHAVMVAGFGTIAGSVLGAYLGFGIQAVYVITACVMAAPCALATAKLVYPETKKSKFTTTEGLILEKTDQRNVIEAAFVGASQAIPLVLNIGGNLIAFLSLLAAINGFLGWFGGLLDFPQLSFELICSYVFMPITYLMGISWSDCFKAAELVGTKVFLNEFIAYEELAVMIDNRDNGTIPRNDPETGATLWVDERTEAIVTYALCGFANAGSLGIMLGGLGSMAPKRQSEMAKIVLRALIAGIFVSILNACVAGFLYVPRPILCDNMLASTNWTYTETDRLIECCSRPEAMANSTISCNCCNWFNATTTVLGYCEPSLNC